MLPTSMWMFCEKIRIFNDHPFELLIFENRIWSPWISLKILIPVCRKSHDNSKYVKILAPCAPVFILFHMESHSGSNCNLPLHLHCCPSLHFVCADQEEQWGRAKRKVRKNYSEKNSHLSLYPPWWTRQSLQLLLIFFCNS